MINMNLQIVLERQLTILITPYYKKEVNMEINKQEMLPGLYGSQISINKMVGYCKYHRCALTVKTLKCHECLNKQCNALQKCEEHDYWRQRAQRKELRKLRKERLN